jgi:hypothetical protein
MYNGVFLNINVLFHTNSITFRGFVGKIRGEFSSPQLILLCFKECLQINIKVTKCF